MAIVFGICIAVMLLMRLVVPLKQAVEFKAKTELDLAGSKGALRWGIVCVVLTLALYVIFSPLVVAK